MPSPFLYGNPVPPERFVGRRRELRRILGRLADNGQSTFVLGEPRAGKTSLLDYIASPQGADALRHGDSEHILVSYLDSHTLDCGMSLPAFWERALEPIDALDGVLSADASARGALRVCREGGFETRRISTFLASLHLAKIRLVLLIDEFDYFVQSCVTEPRVFFGSLRSITTRSRGALSLVLASRRSIAYLEDIAQGSEYSGSPLFNFLTEEILGPLSSDEVNEILESAKDCFSADDVRLVHNLAGGLPFLVQLVAEGLWRAYEDGKHDPVERHADAASMALREASRVLGNIWRQQSPTERYVFASIAIRQLRALDQRFFDSSRFTVETAALVDQGFVVRDGPGQTRLRVGSRLFWVWCLLELQAKGQSLDSWNACMRDHAGAIPMSQGEKLAWTDAVRDAVAGVKLADSGWYSGTLSMPSESVVVRSNRIPSNHPRQRLKITFAYAEEDDRHRDLLDRHLAALRHEGLIETWSDQRIAPGEDWHAELNEALRGADIIVLLISADFIASNLCFDLEMKTALERHETGTVRVIPVAVRSVDWGTLPFASFHALPRGRKPIALWSDPDEAWAEVATGIRCVVESMLSEAGSCKKTPQGQ